MADFSSKDDEELVKLVSGYPCLFDSRDSDYKNICTRENTWRTIGSQMNKNPVTCKSRWRSIKDTYLRQKRKLESRKGKPSVYSKKNPRCKYNFYSKLLGFLQDVPKRTREDLDFSKVDNDDTEMVEVSSNEDSDEEDVKPGQCDFGNDDYGARTYQQKQEVASSMSQYAATYISENEGDLSSFAMHVKDVLKKLSPLLRIRAKQEIFEVLMKYEAMAVEDPLRSSHSSHT